MKNTKDKKRKNTKTRLLESVILLLLTLCLFVSATFAWFTDSAFSKGNKIFAGNLYVDVIVDEATLKAKYISEYNAWRGSGSETQAPFSQFVIEKNLDYKLYQRKYINPEFGNTPDEPQYLTENYYIVSDKDAGAINLYNVEPGQVNVFKINYLNTGDLAFRAAGALKIDVNSNGDYESYTGLETLNRQLNKGSNNKFDVYHNKYSVTDIDNNTIDPAQVLIDNLDNDVNNNHFYISKGFIDDPNTLDIDEREVEYNYRVSKLLEMQSELDDNGSPKKYTSSFGLKNPFQNGSDYYENIGGYLQDILEIYVLPDDLVIPNNNVSSLHIPSFNREILDPGNPLHDLYCFGTLEQFEFLVAHGIEANADFVLNNNFSTIEDLKQYAETNENEITVDEKYKIIMNDLEANLSNDYERYLSYAGGYCLPKDVLIDNNDCVPKDGVTVKVDGASNYVASEIGHTNLFVYMPESASSLYQNASISLSLGVTATQVEYEMDDTGCMIYDKSEKTKIDDVNLGDILMFTSIPLDDKREISIKMPFTVIKKEDNKVTLMIPIDFINLLSLLQDSTPSQDSEDQLFKSYIQFMELILKGNDLSKYVASTQFIDKNLKTTGSGLDYQGTCINFVQCVAESTILGKSNASDAFCSKAKESLPENVPPEVIKQSINSFAGGFKGIFDELISCAVTSNFNQFAYEMSDSEAINNKIYSLDNNTYFAGPYYSASDSGNEVFVKNEVDSYLRLLTLKDIYDYYGTDSITSEQVKNFIYGKKNDDAAPVWLVDSVIQTPKFTAGNSVETPDFSNFNSLLVNTDGSITSENIINGYGSNGDPNPSVHETRYVFTVDFSKLNNNSFDIYPKELDNVDLSYDAPIWDGIVPIVDTEEPDEPTEPEDPEEPTEPEEPQDPAADGFVDILYLYDDSVNTNNDNVINSYINSNLINDLNTKINEYNHDPFKLIKLNLDTLDEFASSGWYIEFDDILDYIYTEMNINRYIDYIIVNSKIINYDTIADYIYLDKFNVSDTQELSPIRTIYVGTCDMPDSAAHDYLQHINNLLYDNLSYEFNNSNVLFGYCINTINKYFSYKVRVDDTSFRNYFKNFDSTSATNGKLQVYYSSAHNNYNYYDDYFSWLSAYCGEEYFYNSTYLNSTEEIDNSEFIDDLNSNNKSSWLYNKCSGCQDATYLGMTLTNSNNLLEYNNLVLIRDFTELNTVLAKLVDYSNKYPNENIEENSKLEIFLFDLDGLTSSDVAALSTIKTSYPDYLKFLHYIYVDYKKVESNLVNYICSNVLPNASISYVNPYWGQTELSNFKEYDFK